MDRRILSALALSAGLLVACSSSTPPVSPDTMTPSSSAGSVSWDGTLLSGKHTVVLKTSKGDITIELDADLAPKTVTNFVTLAKSGYYNNLTFHRVIPGFMIQGGDPSGNGTGGRSIYGEMFEDEIDPSGSVYSGGYKAGAIAMANRGPDTNGSQFFIMDTDYPLPPNYTIFGKVTKGQEVVNTIARVERGSNDRPIAPVTFTPEVRN
jgi:cyclophilin family peptidyl-prolyl cis-trans isomerase